MESFLALVLLLLMGGCGLLSFFASGSFFLLALTVMLAGFTYLSVPWSLYVAAGVVVAQLAWLGYRRGQSRRFEKQLRSSQEAPYFLGID